MKKLSIISFAIIALSLTSCKKDRTCTCTTTIDGVTSPEVTVTYKKVTKKSAKAACLSTDITPSSSPEEVKKCTLK